MSKESGVGLDEKELGAILSSECPRSRVRTPERPDRQPSSGTPLAARGVVAVICLLAMVGLALLLV
jgi:hypothetical protein